MSLSRNCSLVTFYSTAQKTKNLLICERLVLMTGWVFNINEVLLGWGVAITRKFLKFLICACLLAASQTWPTLRLPSVECKGASILHSITAI